MEKWRDKQLQWNESVILADENSLTKKDLRWRPKQRWLGTLDGDLKVSHQHLDQVYE